MDIMHENEAFSTTKNQDHLKSYSCTDVKILSQKILSELNTFRCRGILCDVVLQSKEGQQYQAHGPVLAAASGTFADCLANQSLQFGTILSLSGLNTEELRCLLNFIYCIKPINKHEFDIVSQLVVPFRLTSTTLLNQESENTKPIDRNTSSYWSEDASDSEDNQYEVEDTVISAPENNLSIAENLEFIRANAQPTKNLGKFKCKFCEKTFSRIMFLSRHERIHEKKNYSCDICNKSFLLPYYLKVHKRTHNSRDQITCKKCGLTFLSLSKLDYHLYTRHAEKHFKCVNCGKIFYTKSRLKVHMRVHSTEPKPWQCSVCDKSYTTKGILTTHMLIHKAVRLN